MIAHFGDTDVRKIDTLAIEEFFEWCRTPNDGVVDSMIFDIENHRIPSHYDLHMKNFNSVELKFSLNISIRSVSATISSALRSPDYCLSRERNRANSKVRCVKST